MYLSFETAKHLHELGVTFPESEVDWAFVNGDPKPMLTPVDERDRLTSWCLEENIGFTLFSAPCFEDLWRALPSFIWVSRAPEERVMCTKEMTTHFIRYKDAGPDYAVDIDPSPTEAAGKLLGILKEKNLI